MAHIDGIIVEGHKVASGTATNSPYPAGSIAMQTPFFKGYGIDLELFYKATLNISIAPHQFRLHSPAVTARHVQWADGFDAETFSFSACQLGFNHKQYEGLIYYPHPETKLDHFHSPSLIEVITEYIAGIHYEDKVRLDYNPAEITIC